MTCKSWRKQMSAYLDGELGPAEAAALESHVETCGACANAVAELRSALQLLDDHPGLEPSSDFDARFARRLQQEQARQRAEQALAPWWRWRWPALVTVAAAVCAVCGFLILGRDRPSRELAPAELEMVAKLDLLRDYQTISHLDGLDDYEVVAQLDELLEGEQP